MTVPNEPHNNSERAKKCNTEGLAYLAKGKVDEAEASFRDALAADVDYAPAHNNLGQIYLKRHQLYLAAWEFQFAANLMPGRPESLINLGLVYETGNRLAEAQAAYESALEIDSSNAIALGNLARVCVKMNDDPSKIHYLLSELVFIDNRSEWLKWAQDLLATRYQPAAWGPDTAVDSRGNSAEAIGETSLRAGPLPNRDRKLELVPPPSQEDDRDVSPLPAPSKQDSSTRPPNNQPVPPELPAPLRASPSSFELPVKRAPKLELSRRSPPYLRTPQTLNHLPSTDAVTSGNLTARTIDLTLPMVNTSTANTSANVPNTNVASEPSRLNVGQVQPAQYQAIPGTPVGLPYPASPQ